MKCTTCNGGEPAEMSIIWGAQKSPNERVLCAGNFCGLCAAQVWDKLSTRAAEHNPLVGEPLSLQELATYA